VSLYRDIAVVLRTYKLGESDRIIVLFTRDRGKVRAVAKGVRKTKSKFGSRLEPTSYVSLQLYEGRDLDIVTQAELVEAYPAIRGDLDRLGRAASILEVMDQVVQEGEPNRELFEMLLGGLRTIEKRDTPLVTPAFFFKVLGAEGVGLTVDSCIKCGAEDVVALDLEDGGVTCAEHRRGIDMSTDAATLLGQMLGGSLAWALDQPPGPATYELDHLAHTAMERHVDRRLKALKLLKGR
jgi:DNA repair protein RecO (recombination protein O)